MDTNTLTIIFSGILVAVVVLVIVKKFGRIIVNLLTILGGLTVLSITYLLYTSIKAGIDLDIIKTLLEIVK